MTMPLTGGVAGLPNFNGAASVVEAKQVNEFHTRSDKDNSILAQHHTLGVLENQASPGPHTHDGRISKQLKLSDLTISKQTITGSRASGAALTSLLAGLVSLGLITDSTIA